MYYTLIVFQIVCIICLISLFMKKDSVNFLGIYIGNMASITLKQPYWRKSSLGLLYPCQRELGLKKIHYADKDISKKEGTRNQNEILWSMPLH